MTIQRAFASANNTLDQTSYAQVDSMTMTPGAGDYLAVFSMDVTYNASPGSETMKVAIYVNGVQQQHSIRTIQQNGSLPSMWIAVVTSAYVSPTAGQVVEVKYIASSGSNPMTGARRELTLLPAEQTNYQDTDIVNDTIATTTWTTIDTMTRTPAAGDYLLVFTTSASTPADEEVGFRLSVGGSPVAHTERRVMVEGSADPSSYCTLIAASISPNGSQVVEIEWARITGAGTQTCYERNMIMIEVDSADIFQASGTVDDTDSTTSDVAIDDLAIINPGAVDYLVLFSSFHFYGTLAAPGAGAYYKIFNAGSEETDLTRFFEHEDSIDDTYMSVFTTGRITVADAADDILAYWKGQENDLRTLYERTLVAVADPSSPAPANNPTIETTNSGTGSGTSHAISMPAGISAGDLLLVFFATDGDNTITNWQTFTELDSESYTTANFGAMGYKYAAGSDTLTITTSVSEPSAHVTYRISGHDSGQIPEASTVAEGNSNTPTPTGVTPTGGSKDYLWFGVAGCDRRTFTDYPAGYDLDQLTSNSGGAGGCSVAAAGRNYTGDTETAGNFTIDSGDTWTAWTVAVHPIASTEAFDDITLKTSLVSAATYEDVTLKVTVESAATFEDITLKTSLWITKYKDITLKATLESAVTFEDITLKTSLWITNYKDVVLKTSVESAPTFEDITLKVSLEAAPVAASWWSEINDTESGSFTNTSLNEKYTLDFTAPAQGDYLILVSFAGRVSGGNAFWQWRVQLDDTTTIAEGLREQNQGNQLYNYDTCATAYLAKDLASGAHYIDIDAAVESGNTAYMRYAKIIVVRLDDWLPTTGMYDSAATEGETALTDSWATIETLTFTPDQAGDYLILGSCEVKPGTTTTTANVRLNYDSASEYLPVSNAEESGDNYACYEPWNAASYWSWVWGGIVSIPASEKTIILEGISTSATESDVRKRRIIAIRIGAMDSAANTDEDPANTSTTSQWTEKSTITFSPASTEDYLLLAGIVLKPDSTLASGHTRLEQTAGTDTGTIAQDNFDSKDSNAPADCSPQFVAHIKSLAAVSQTFKTQWGYGQAGTFYSKGSFIIAIRKPTAGTTAYEDVTLKTSLESAPTYEDITLKTTLESIPTFEDITLKTSIMYKGFEDITLKVTLESAPTFDDITLKVTVVPKIFKDITLKTTLESVPTFDDITLKTSVESAATYKDMTLQVTLESALTFEDITLKVTVASEAFEDITLKVSLSYPYTVAFEDVTLKTSLESPSTTAYEDITLKVSLESAPTFKDITLKVTLESALTYEDVTLKTTLESVPIFDDVTLQVTLESAITYKDITLKISVIPKVLKDITLKTSLVSALTFDDITLKVSLIPAPAYKDITLKVTLESAPTFEDVTLQVSLESAPTFEDVALKTTLESVPTFEDITLKVTVAVLTYEDVTLKTSLVSAPTYEDITLKVTLVAPLAFRDITLQVTLTGMTRTDVSLKTSLRRMSWYYAYNPMMNQFKAELESIPLAAFNNKTFEDVSFGPWEGRPETPCAQILEMDGMTETQLISKGTFLVDVPATVHIFIDYPWKRKRGIRTAREAILRTVGDIWDHFMQSPAKTLGGLVYDCVPQAISLWDLDKDWEAYHAEIRFSMQLYVVVQ